jgi:hypothetical protein
MTTFQDTDGEATGPRAEARSHTQGLMSSWYRVFVWGLTTGALLAGCTTSTPIERGSSKSPLRAQCDRKLRPLDRYVGPKQQYGALVSPEGMKRVARGLAWLRPAIRERLDHLRRPKRLTRLRSRLLMRLLWRAETAARAGQDRRLVHALEEAWLVAARLGIPECHITFPGRPS